MTRRRGCPSARRARSLPRACAALRRRARAIRSTSAESRVGLAAIWFRPSVLSASRMISSASSRASAIPLPVRARSFASTGPSDQLNALVVARRICSVPQPPSARPRPDVLAGRGPRRARPLGLRDGSGRATARRTRTAHGASVRAAEGRRPGARCRPARCRSGSAACLRAPSSSSIRARPRQRARGRAEPTALRVQTAEVRDHRGPPDVARSSRRRAVRASRRSPAARGSAPSRWPRRSARGKSQAGTRSGGSRRARALPPPARRHGCHGSLRAHNRSATRLVPGIGRRQAPRTSGCVLGNVEETVCCLPPGR